MRQAVLKSKKLMKNKLQLDKSTQRNKSKLGITFSYLRTRWAH